MARILIADSDLHFSTALQCSFEEQLWDVEVARDGKEALNYLCTKYFDVLVLDFCAPGLSGLEILRAIQQRGIRIAVVMTAESATVEIAVQSIKAGAQEFIKKTMGISHFNYILCKVLERHHGSPHYLAYRLDVFIRDHCFRSSLSIDELCKQFNISSRYISKLFQHHIGIPFRRRLLYYRVQRAKRLIESTDQPLYLIAEQCGFKNQGRLTEAFRRIERISPKRYRTIFKD